MPHHRRNDRKKCNNLISSVKMDFISKIMIFSIIGAVNNVITYVLALMNSLRIRKSASFKAVRFYL